ncbi:DNA-binding response regulator [Flavilitoribacter nigricans DSM 23189 = NBRC 102662]|uniref:DNA-binding response regulator n=1 Tax=Flavilitoribacter nigricans (strain ATCC 23147 / DSM 23189 / NBRC 102662 / NCIMB 1420 / SS-2) TaxID=1122177 RepID=A0A2D0N8R2_FLAN2|nr:DNA-binding response regulator [Flavilitoribacter nigricans DSM 23189 = NBRC 102662]
MKKILIADDHQLVIDGIKLMLSTETDLECVADAHSGQEVLDYLQNKPVDMVILDINMPDLNGVETCRILQRDYPEVKVLALSMLKEASLIKLMLKNGAHAYVLKHAGKEEVIQAIRKVFAGQNYYSEEVSEIIMASLAGQSTKEKPQSPFPQLSRREKQVLRLIVDEFTTAEIAEKLHISFGTVETHRRNILIKLGARNTAGLVRTAIEYGLLED